MVFVAEQKKSAIREVERKIEDANLLVGLSVQLTSINECEDRSHDVNY